MEQIQKTVEYYQLMIDKFEKTGQSPKQLQIYKEIKALVLECSSYEEIQSNMKNQGHFESPAQALYLDRMMAQKNAAKENGFTELEELYQNRYNEVEADGSKMHDGSYANKAVNILSKYNQLLDALFEIYLNYLYYNSSNVYDDFYKRSLKKIQEKHAVFASFGTSFQEISKHKYYRGHIGLSDEKYTVFISEVEVLLNKHEPERSEMEGFEATTKEMWEKLKDKEAEVKQIGKLQDARTKRSVSLVVPPIDKDGKYDFIMNEQEAF